MYNENHFMPDLQDGETTEMQGSGSKPYALKTGGVYSCSCPAWRNQSIAIEKRSCKHLRKLRGDAAEEARTGGALPQRPVKANGDGESETDSGPALLLAESWDNATDLSDWWMSEKLDGVRAYWDGKQFISRQGNLTTPRLGSLKGCLQFRSMVNSGSIARSFNARSASFVVRTRMISGTKYAFSSLTRRPLTADLRIASLFLKTP